MKIFPFALKEYNLTELNVLICLDYYDGHIDGFITDNDNIYYYCEMDFCSVEYRKLRNLSDDVDLTDRYVYGLFSLDKTNLTIPLIKFLCEERQDNTDFHKSFFKNKYDLTPFIFAEDSLVGWFEW
jgi:hypothetical protein